MPFQFTNEATLQQVVSTALELVSLVPPSSVTGSTDTAVRLMVTSANLANLELLNAHEWVELTRTGEIVVSNPTPPNPGQAIELPYDLPEDFFRFIDQTQWNASMRFPAVGPVSPQGWMTYLVFPISANFTLTWQVRDGKIWFLNPPAPPGQTFRFMYLSRAVVQDATDPAVFKNIANKDGDKFVLDGTLLTLLTRVKWLEAKGFDSTAAARDYTNMWDTRVGAKKGANILNMSKGQSGYPYIGIGNLPDASLYGMRQW